jgi:hypothetical protein
MYPVRNKASFCGEELSAPSPTLKVEDNNFSAVLYRLFNILAATLHFEARSYIRNLRTRHAMVKGTSSYTA